MVVVVLVFELGVDLHFRLSVDIIVCTQYKETDSWKWVNNDALEVMEEKVERERRCNLYTLSWKVENQVNQ